MNYKEIIDRLEKANDLVFESDKIIAELNSLHPDTREKILMNLSIEMSMKIERRSSSERHLNIAIERILNKLKL